MGVIESYEYYPACPNCGAANTGKEKCEYCGASLIRSKTNTNINDGIGYNASPEERKNYEQDINYPEISGKLCEKDEFVLIFCPIFGGIFLLVPTIIAVAFTASGIMEAWVWLMLGVFWLIGICGIAPLVSYIVGRIKCRTGEEITGIVRGYEESMVTVNGKPVLKVRILIDEFTDPKILVINTGVTKKLFPIGLVVRLRNYKNKYIINK